MFKVMKVLIMLIVMANVGGAVQVEQKHGPSRIDGLEIDVWVNKGEGSTYYYGEDVAIYFRTNSDCYVVIYDIDPSGNVSLLFPADYGNSCYVEGGEIYRIPDIYDDYQLEVSGPSGTEYIYAVATYNRIDAPDFIRYEYFEYGNWDYYYDDFVHSVRGERAAFAADLNWRIARGDHVSDYTIFRIDDGYRHHRWYRHWTYDPYYLGSVWIGVDYPGCEVWIDGIYYGIAPILIPEIYIGRHWIWIYYHGYPCWQDYFYVVRGQRYYVDVKINRRYLDYEYGRGNLRDWRFKYERHRNESGFHKKAEKVRVKHTRPRPLAPIKVVDKYSRKSANRSGGSGLPDERKFQTQERQSKRNSGSKIRVYDNERKSTRQSADKKNKGLMKKLESAIFKEESGKTEEKFKETTKAQKKETKSRSSKPSKVSKPKPSTKSSSGKNQSSKISGSKSKREGKRSKK